MSDLQTTRLLKQGLPLYTVLASVLLVLALGAILRLGSEIFVPIALAGILSFVLAPLLRLFQRVGLPSWAALALTVILAFGFIGSLVTVVANQITALAGNLPTYQVTIATKLNALSSTGGVSGTLGRSIEALQGILRQVETLGPGSSDGHATVAAQPVRIVDDGSNLIGTIGGFLSPLLHPVATTVIVLIFVIFVLNARGDLRNRFVRLVGTDDIQRTTALIDDAARRLSRLFLMQLAVNTAFGTVIALGLWAIGLPSPFLWGIIAGILRFVPYVGAFIGASLPLLLSIAVDPGWSMMVMTGLLFLIVEPIVGHVLEPFLFGHSTGLSPISVILSATVWTFLWGPIGLVLATPITVCLVVLGRHVPSLAFIDILLGDRPALSPPELFYQRMLAGDPSEAIQQAREFLRGRALATYYDEVALEGLRLAHEDIARGRLTPDRQTLLRESTAQLVEGLDKVVGDPRPKGGQLGSEAAAAVLAAGPDSDEAISVLTPSDLPATWGPDAGVLCIARGGTLDNVIATMLAQVFDKHGIPVKTLRIKPNETPDLSAAGHPKIVCLSFVEPLSTLHLRYFVRAARRQFPGARIMLCIWRERDPHIARLLGRASRANRVMPTIKAALSEVLSEIRSAKMPTIAAERQPALEPARSEPKRLEASASLA